MKYTGVSPDEFAALDGLSDWRYVLGAIRTEFRSGSYPAAAALVSAIADAAERANHHPEIDVRYPDRVLVSLVTHAAGGLTNLDVEAARMFSDIAVECGAVAFSDATQAIELAIDTMDADRIRPFWAAALGYRDDGFYLTDPLGAGPPLWFQQMDEPRPGRGRFHVDISVPHDAAERRIQEALAAGGVLVSDEFARSWWVLADADGNEACICTWQDR